MSLDETILPGHRRGTAVVAPAVLVLWWNHPHLLLLLLLLLLLQIALLQSKKHRQQQQYRTFQCINMSIGTVIVRSTDDGMLLSLLSSDSDFPHGGMVILVAMRLLILLFLH